MPPATQRVVWKNHHRIRPGQRRPQSPAPYGALPPAGSNGQLSQPSSTLSPIPPPGIDIKLQYSENAVDATVSGLFRSQKLAGEAALQFEPSDVQAISE